MKKLMFALIAGVAVSAVHADAFNSGTSFENFADPAVTTGAKEGSDVDTYIRYVASGSSENGSTIKAYGSGEGDVSAFSGDRNAFFTGTNSKYLELSTDGGTLYRTVNDCTTDLGDAKPVPSTGLWIDTVVQFTVCDSAPTVDSGAKLAVWLQADEDLGTTNLMVRAKKWEVYADGNAAGFLDGGTTDLVLAGTYQAGAWYRLTVEAVPNMFSDGKYAAGFKIKINGSDVAAAAGSCFALADGETGNLADLLAIHANAAEVTAMTSGAVFASLADASVSTVATSPSLSAVGFSGTGLVDDVLFTDADPFYVAPTTLDFTITLASGVTSAKYFVGTATENVTTNNVVSGTAITGLALGETVTVVDVVLGAPVTGWQVNAPVLSDAVNCTASGLAVTLPTESASGTASVTVDVGAKTVSTAAEVDDALAAVGITQNSALLTYLGSDPAKYAALVEWATDNSYTPGRVDAYAYAADRLAADLPIETSLVVTFDTDAITDLTATLDAENDAIACSIDVDLTAGEISAIVDAGYGFTLSEFTFGSVSGVQQQLQTDASSADWALDKATITLGTGTVQFKSTVAANNDAAGEVATMDAAATTFDFTVTFASPVSGVSYVIDSGSAQAAESGVAIKVPVGSTITLTPAASSLAIPAFYTLSGETKTYFTTLDPFSAAGSVEIGAVDAKDVEDTTAAETAAANAIVAVAGAAGDAVAAQLATLAAAGVPASDVAAWKESTGSSVSYADFAAAVSADVSIKLGTSVLFTSEPEAAISAMTEGTGSYALTFTISDGTHTATPADTAAVKEYVQGLVKMTSNLSDWTTGALTPTVAVTVSGSTLTATVTPPANTPAAFMKIGK